MASCSRSSSWVWRALAIPVAIHLIQREKKQIIAFPSLMFVRRVPYESVRRRKIRHWALLAMRLAALALIVAAFARPFVRGVAVGDRPAGRARSWCCSIAPTAWATATAGRGRRRRPGRRSTAWARPTGPAWCSSAPAPKWCCSQSTIGRG